MTLERDPVTGTHRWIPPHRPYVGSQDALGRTSAPGAPVTAPIGGVHYTQPEVVKDHSMSGYEVVTFQMEIYDVRGTWEQDGPMNEAHANFASNEMVADAPNVMRHPFAVKEDECASGDWVEPASTVSIFGRMVWAVFRRKVYVTMGRSANPATPAPVIWAETSPTNPVLAEVTTYAPGGAVTNIVCMATLVTGGLNYLFVGYASGGCQAFALATLATPIAVNIQDLPDFIQTAPSGFIQAPNGDILVVTTTGDLLLATDTTVTPGSLTFTGMQLNALGLYPVAVGNCALANYAPGALWWCSDSDEVSYFAANSNATAAYAASSNPPQNVTPRGHLVLASYDCLTLDPIDFPDLPYISFPTLYRGGVLACDRRSHYWYTGKAMISTDGGADRPVDSHKTRECCGHAVVDDRYVRIEAEIDDRFVAASPNAAYNTIARVIEYDPYRGRERPISMDVDLGFGGNPLVVGGGPTFPVSPSTNNLHWFSIFEGFMATRNQDFGRFWRQYQQDSNVQGYALRSTDSDTSGGPVGFEGFDDDPTYTSPEMWHPALSGYEYTPVRVIMPRVEALQQGGDDANVDITIGDYSGNVSAAEPSERYPTLELGEWPNRSWYTTLQLILTSHLGTGVTHKTQNVLPLTIEVVARRPLPKGIRL